MKKRNLSRLRRLNTILRKMDQAVYDAYRMLPELEKIAMFIQGQMRRGAPPGAETVVSNQRGPGSRSAPSRNQTFHVDAPSPVVLVLLWRDQWR